VRRVVFFYGVASLFHPLKKETEMDSKKFKKVLAGLGVAGLISAGGITLPGSSAGASG